MQPCDTRISVRSGLRATVTALVMFTAGCGAEHSLAPADGKPTATTKPRPSSDAGAPSDTAPSPVCEVPHVATEASEVAFESLSARVVDANGKPVVGTLAQACGINVCLPGKTDNRGLISIENPQQLKGGAFKYGDGLLYAQFALALDTEATHDLGDQVTVAFPNLTSGTQFTSGATLESQDVTLEIPEGADISLDLLAFPEPEQHVFLAQSVAKADYPAAARNEPGLAVLWALAPLKTKLCPRAHLRVPNTTGLKASSSVEFVLHSTDVTGAWAAYTQWGAHATGHVTTDGQWIETDADSGIEQLGVFGIRAVP